MIRIRIRIRIKRHLIHLHIAKKGGQPIINTILHPIFTTAVRDGLIRMNPSDGVMAEIKKSHDWEKPKRHALTEAQQTAFVDYVANHKQYSHWLSVLTVLLGTGCRVGEVVGLRWEDCDFEAGTISVNHNLIYRIQDSGKCEFHITTPKTKSGIRMVPMLSEVKKALEEERERQSQTGFNQTEIDGYSGFIFQNRYGECMSSYGINRAIDRICRDYNAEETERAKAENREPELLAYMYERPLIFIECGDGDDIVCYDFSMITDDDMVNVFAPYDEAGAPVKVTVR